MSLLKKALGSASGLQVSCEAGLGYLQSWNCRFGGFDLVGSGMDGLRALHAPKLSPTPLPSTAALAHWQGSMKLGQVSKRPWTPGVREMPHLPL